MFYLCGYGLAAFLISVITNFLSLAKKIMDFRERGIIDSEISSIEELFNLRFWYDQNYCRPALIAVLIDMRDLLAKADSIGRRVDFTDDVIADERLRIKDITDLITNFRHAACHNDSNRHEHDGNYFSFNIFEGNQGFVINGEFIGSKYADDLAFNFGKHSLYLKRHLFRTFSELKLIFSAENR